MDTDDVFPYNSHCFLDNLVKMGQKNKKAYVNLRNILLAALIVFSIGDIVTTIIGYFTLPFLNESSPIVTAGGSIWLLFLIKILVISYLVWFCIKKYHTIPTHTGRYLFVYIIVILTVLSIGAVHNNTKIVTLPAEEKAKLQPMTTEQKTEFYEQGVYNLEIVKPESTPIIVPMFILNVLQFITWRSFEKNDRRLRSINT